MPNVQPLSREQLAEFEPLFDLMERAIGFVPRSHNTMGHRPEIEKAFSQLVIAVFGPGTVDFELKQLVALMASVSAGCRYCQAHTAYTAAKRGSPERVEAVFDFETSELFTEAERAALRLARDAAIVPNATTPDHFAALREHYDDEQIVEIVSAISIMGWLNRWNDTMATELEDEPLAFAEQSLSGHGWQAGKHAAESKVAR